FCPELGVGGAHVALQPVGLEAMLGPYPSYCHVVGLEHLSQLANAPMGRTVRRDLSGALQNTRLQRRGKCSGFAALVPAEQSGQALRFEALAPARNEAVVASQLVAHLRPGMFAGQQKNAPR